MAGSGIVGKFARIWSQIGVNQRISIFLVGFGSIAAVAGLVYWGGRPSYGLLYSGLSRKDAGAVVAQLESESIPYRLEDNGTTVLVAGEQVQKARAKLLTQGLPAGGDGFEILDKRSLGMTDFAERKTYLRAVQGELARTIGSIEGIEWARVHLTAPEPSVFLEKDRPTTASVLVNTRGGARLSPTQVASIAALVARSVEGLEPKNVTISPPATAPGR
jgi:flagellar M-ring protein FliF